VADQKTKQKQDQIRFARDAGSLGAARKRLYSGLSRDHIEWKMNREFYKGNQWVFPNPVTGTIQDLNFGLGDTMQPRFKVRLTSNQIKSGVMAYIAQLTKTKPVISATPNSGDDKDLRAAQTAEALFEYWWREFDMKSKLQSALVNAQLSQGYWKISWDPYAGKGTTFMIGPDGKPITDPVLADLFKEELEAHGVDPKQYSQTVNLGDIRIEVMPGENVILDPAAATFEDASYAICKHAMDPAEIYARWGVDVQADGASTSEGSGSGLPWGIDSRQGPEQTAQATKDVWIMYHKKSPQLPKGRYVAWVEGPDKILADTEWQFPFDELPLVHFPGLERPGSPLDDPLVTDARPIQKELNRTLSQIVQHKNLTIKPQMIAPVNSLRDRLTDEPGAVFQYSPVMNQKPEWREMPSLPPYVFEHLQDIQNRLDRLFNLAAVSQGNVPPNVEAGVAIDLLQEASVDQVSPMIQRMEGALVRAGHIMASFAAEYYIEPRLLKIMGSGGTVQVKKFKNSDISGGFSFHAESGSGLPRTRAGKQARIEWMLQNGLADPKQALKMLDVADSHGLLARLQADEDMALREHEKLKAGQPLNVVALQQAMQQVQQMMADPNADVDGDGQPDPPEAKIAAAQQMLHQAALQPQPYEDFESHLTTHSSYMKSNEYEKLPPEIQQGFIDHYNATLQTLMSIPQRPEPKAVQTTLQLKGTIGPTAASEILNKGGVLDVTPEQMAEQPLETWVSDSIDKPDADEAGNDPLTQAEKLQSMALAQDQADLNAMKTAHQAALAHQKGQQADLAAQQQRDHADQAHQQRLRHAEQKQADARRAAREATAQKGGGNGR
jgi:hypothetical protein